MSRNSKTKVTRAAVNAKLAKWLDLLMRCERHREIEKEFQAFKELLLVAPLDPELAAAVTHYKNSTPEEPYPQYTGCIFELQELALEREAAAA